MPNSSLAKSWNVGDFLLKSICLYIKLTSKNDVQIETLNMCTFHFGLPRNICAKDAKMAAEVVGDRLLVLFWCLKYI